MIPFHSRWLLALTLVIAACRPVEQPSRPTAVVNLDDELTRDIAAESGLVWSQERLLRWSDFEARPPGEGPEGALTAYSLFYGLRCVGARLQFRVVAAFLPSQSWVKGTVLASPALSRQTLRHEQTHFNISELHARRMRRFFAELYSACSSTSDQLRVLAERFVTEEGEEQSRYDDETRHGLRPQPQALWDQDVDERLAALRAFAR